MANINISSIWEDAWRLILRGTADSKHPYATPALGTTDPLHGPRLRTVVLRKADQTSGWLRCYTDRRSIKAQQLGSSNQQAAWLFWDPRSRIQFSCSGTTHWMDEETTQSIFRSLPKHSRKAYATVAPPGSIAREVTDGLPTDWENYDQEQTQYASENFGVLITRIEWAEVLQLQRSGHRRLRADRKDGDEWTLQWLVP